MNRFARVCLCAVLSLASVSFAAAEDVYPAAILTFAERDQNVKGYGAQVTDLLFAELSANPNLFLVDREEFNKTMAEQSLGATGAVKPGEEAAIGQLTGAKILISGSVMQVDKKLYLVAKIMGTETSRVLGAKANGKASDELGPLVEQLATNIGETIEKQSASLVAKKETKKDRMESVQKALAGAKLPSVIINVSERHFGAPSVDPAAETEISSLALGAGFKVLDSKEAATGAAEVTITGEAFSESAGRLGSLSSAKARVELKATDRKSGKVLAIDRQTAVVVDATDQIAGKAAIQEAAGQLAERFLPKLKGAGEASSSASRE